MIEPKDYLKFCIIEKKNPLFPVFDIFLLQFSAVRQGDAAREDSARSGTRDRPDHVRSSGGGGRSD